MELQKKNLYDIKYKYAADYAFCVNSYFEDKKFKYLNCPISVVKSGGISDDNRISVLIEWLSIIKKKSLYGCAFMLLRIIVEFLKYPLRKIIKKIHNL